MAITKKWANKQPVAVGFFYDNPAATVFLNYHCKNCAKRVKYPTEI